MLDDLETGITVHDPDTGAILAVNQRLERLYGYPAEQLREMVVEDYTADAIKYTQEEAVRRIRAAAKGDPQKFDWQIERANGEVRWVDVHLRSTTIDGQACVIAEITDITEERARERRLRLLSRIIRHNLRNRMNIIIGHTEQLEIGESGKHDTDSLETILETAKEAGKMTESVQQIEEIADPNATQRTPTDAGDLVRSTAEKMASKHPKANLSVDIESDVKVVADDGIRYAIEHAIENAIVHNDNLEPDVEIAVTNKPESDHADLKILDDGPPIPDIETDVLVEGVDTSSTYHGSGVGLWVMQWCVNSLGGELSFEERADRGNIVTISLPMSDSNVSESEPTRSGDSVALDQRNL